MGLRQEGGEISPSAWLGGAAVSVTLATAPLGLLQWIEMSSAIVLSTAFGAIAAICFFAAGRQHYVNQGRLNPPDSSRSSVPPLPDSAPHHRAQGGRLVVSATPEYLVGIFQDPQHTTDEARRLFQPYVGKWMEVSGTVDDVNNLCITLKEYNNVRTGTGCSAHFESKWAQELSVLRKDQAVTILGKISQVHLRSVILHSCELLRAKTR